MLEKELAEAVKLAERANKEVEKMRVKLLKEAEKTVAQGKRELSSARKKQSAANNRLKKARASFRVRPTTDNRKKVDQLVKQAKQMAETTAAIARLVSDAIERYVPIKTDAMVEARKAQAANRAAAMVEKAAAQANRKKKKKPAAKRRRQLKRRPLPRRR